MVNNKAPSSTSLLPSLAVWVFRPFLLAAIDQVQVAKGQTTSAICNNTSWAWSFNSKKQSPCLVAAYLLAPCAREPSESNVPAIAPSTVYSLDKAKANNCKCSTVFYSLVSACGSCQTNISQSWSLWRSNCTESLVSISWYPNNISPDTAVPAWAFLDVVTGDKFDPASAQQVLDVIDFTSPSSTFLSTASASATLAPEGPDNTSNNTPAIIGGIAGGLFSLGVILLLILFYHLKQSSNKGTKLLPTPAVFTRTSMVVSGPATRSSYSPPGSPPGGYSTPDTSGPL